MRWPLLLLPALLCASLSAQDLSSSFVLPEGLALSLWAESPQLFNPTAMDVDMWGRVWVTEAVNYRQWDGRNPGLHREGGDRVVILADKDGDGRCDSSTVFVQDPDLTSPLGICVIGKRVFVSCSPNIFVYTDTDGDDHADKREVFLTGFGGFNHDHGVHSIVAGDDGWLYLAVGNAGPHIVRDKSGFELRSGSIYTGGSPYNTHNEPGLVSDDGRAWTGGLMLRVRPDGTQLEVVADNFRNPYEIARDSFGNLYTGDNDDDGNRSCRLVWVAEGADYGYFSEDGTRYWRADRRPGQNTPDAHWHVDDPGVMPPGSITGAGAPTGVAIYESRDSSDPMASFNGAVLDADAGAGLVYAHLPERVGAGIFPRRSVLLNHTQDGEGGRSRWFRPSDLLVLPDGSILVADWYDPMVGGHGAGDREAYGRLLRIAPQGARDTWEVPPLRRATPQEVVRLGLSGPHAFLIQALGSPSPSIRATARERLLADGELAFEELRSLAGDENPRIAARAVQALALLSDEGRELVEKVLLHPRAEMRAVALRSLDSEDPARLAPHVPSLSRDQDPYVRATLARLLRDYDHDLRLAALVQLSNLYPGDDRYYLESLGIGAEGLEAELLSKLGPLREQGEERYLEILWRLHPPEMVEELVAVASDPERPAELRARMIDALAFVPTREAADAMFILSATGPADLRAHARWWSRQRATNLWRAFDFESESDPNLEDATRVFASGVLRDPRVVDIDVDVTGHTHLILVTTDGGDGNGCDWADWIAPRFILEDGSDTPLESLGWIFESHGWGECRFGKNTEGGPLRVGEDEFSEGIGTHAAAQIVVLIPPTAVRFVAQAGPDAGGTSQGCGTSIEFQVWVRGKPVGAETRRWTEALRAGDVELAREIGKDPAGGLLLVALAQEGALSDEVRAAAGETLFQNPDPSVRALAAAHFRVPGQEKALPPLDELLSLPADAGRGREVFFSEQASCSSCHAFEGRGNDIGPDLTEIHAKYDRSQLLDAILNPSAAISFGYDTYVVRTVDGLIYSGFILAEGEDLVLKDTQGHRHAIPTDEIEVQKKQELSVMPQDVARNLSPQELADLIAFLSASPQSAPHWGEPIELFNGHDLDGWVAIPSNETPEGGAVWSAGDGVLHCTGHPIGYLRTEADYESFELTLEWRFLPEEGPGNSGVLLRMVGEDKVWPKSIEAQLQSEHAGDIWNIDHFPMAVAPERTQGRHTLALLPSNERPLGEWNRYRIRLDRRELTLEVNGLVQNRAHWCEVVPGKICLQSEGAVIEFRNIVLRPILD